MAAPKQKELPMIQQKRILAGALGCLIACSQPAGQIMAAQVPQAQAIGSQSISTQDFKAQEGLAGSAEDQMQAGLAEPSEDQAQAGLSGSMGDHAQAGLSGSMGNQARAGLAESPEDLAPDYDDPDYVKRLFLQENGEEESQALPFSLRNVSAKTTKSPFTGLVYTHAEQLSDSNIVNGIDVSQWQAKINWPKVKAAGAEFVFIRCGYTSLSEKFAMHEDQYFRTNIQGAYDAGLKVGIYFFSNSKTVSEAQQEAEKTLELIDDYKHMITLPVVFDFEAFSNAYRAYGLPKSQVTKNMIVYSDMVEAAGYTPMYYGSPNFLASSYDVSQLTDYDCWLANYTTQTAYTGDYVYWQYSSTGKVDGITGNVDCNFFYSGNDEGLIKPDDIVEGLGPVTGLWMADNATDSITIAWDALEGAAGYKVYRSKSLGGTYKQVKVLSEPDVTEYTDSTVVESEGRQYYYKIVPFIFDEEEGGMKYGMESDILTANTLRLHSFRLKTKANVNLREQAGTEYASLTLIPSGTALTFYKYTLSTLEKKWYKVTYTVRGESYTGYVSGSYVDIFTYGKTKKNVNMRTGAGLAYKVKKTVPQGIKITVVSNTQDSTGTKWSYVKYTLNGKGVAGYIPTKYIKQV